MRRGVVGLLLGLIARISLVVAPVALLALFQFQFLAYHGRFVTDWHRLAVLIDLTILWSLWPRIVRRVDDHERPIIRKALRCVGVLSAATVMALLVLIATFPGEALHDRVPPFALRTWLVEGDVDPLDRTLNSVWSNRLVLAGFDIVDHVKLDDSKLAAMPIMGSLRGRDLSGAVLIGANLPKVDFTGAILDGADFTSANLQEAKFTCADITESVPIIGKRCAEFVGANFSSADLKYSDFTLAHLENAVFDRADLSGAELRVAHAPGALFRFTDLRLADLAWGDFRGSSFEGADLQGANLSMANLTLAELPYATMSGVDLNSSKLSGANLYMTILLAAGVSNASFDATRLVETHLWRAEDLQLADSSRVVAPEIRAVANCPPQSRDKVDPDCAFTHEKFVNLLADLKRISSRAPSGEMAIKRMEERLDPAATLPPQDNDKQDYWDSRASNNLDLQKYERVLFGVFSEIGCAERNNRQFLERLISNSEDKRIRLFTTDQSGAAAKDALLSNKCVNQADREALLTSHGAASSQATKARE